MARVKVKCVEGRRVGDDEYTTGGTYEMDDVRAAKYGDYFAVTGKAKIKRSSKKVQSKNAGATEDK